MMRYKINGEFFYLPRLLQFPNNALRFIIGENSIIALNYYEIQIEQNENLESKEVKFFSIENLKNNVINRLIK